MMYMKIIITPFTDCRRGTNDVREQARGRSKFKSQEGAP